MDICRYTQPQIYFKELIHAIGRLGKSQILRVGWQAGHLGKSYSSSPKSEFLLTLFYLGLQLIG